MNMSYFGQEANRFKGKKMSNKKFCENKAVDISSRALEEPWTPSQTCLLSLNTYSICLHSALEFTSTIESEFSR